MGVALVDSIAELVVLPPSGGVGSGLAGALEFDFVTDVWPVVKIRERNLICRQGSALGF